MNPADYIPELTPEALVVWLAALAAACGVLATWSVLLAAPPRVRRLAALVRRRERLAGAAVLPRRHRLRATGLGVAGRIVQRLRLLQSSQARRTALKLAAAGWRGRDAMAVYLVAKLVGPTLAGSAAAVVVWVLQPWPMPPLAKLMVVLAALLLGAFAPDVVVANATQRRRQQLQKTLPDGLDLLVICAEAGLALDAALARVGRELAASAPELADEIALTAVELGFLPDRRDALQGLARRTGVAGLRALVATLLQTERYGTPLAQALRVLSAEMRTTRLLAAEEKAARLPATLTVPMILFILPALFVVLIGPGALRTIDALRGIEF
ncbi:MAG: type II secretion system F family protein [Alphaproteobacteria bacterium]